MKVHLLDGTYELFRQHFARPSHVTPDGMEVGGTRGVLDSVIGLRRVKVIHVNDSKKALGSRVDRHDHIGRGKIGLEGFTPFVRDEAWEKVPKILETPKEKDEKGRDWDAVNLEVLRSLQ